MQYHRPSELSEALAHLDNGPLEVLAGGTDFYPALVDKQLNSNVLDISSIESLRGVTEFAEHWRIGTTTTWTDIVQLELPPCFKALQQAAREVGSLQIQNRATIGGNLCNASPAADGVPALLILDAEVELSSLAGTRTIPLSQFIQGNRQTELQPGELLTAIQLPRTSTTGVSNFFKLGSRRYLVISIVMTAARILKGPDGEIMSAAVSVGACSAVAKRLPELEKALVGQPFDDTITEIVASEHFDELAPIDDIRSPANYRNWAAEEGVRRSLLACLEEKA